MALVLTVVRYECMCLSARQIPTCPTTGFWQAEQFPLEDVWTPCRLRSDCSSPSMLSKEPPGEGWGGATTGCCGAATAGVTGAAGCRNEKKKVRIFLIDMNNGFKLWAGQRCVQTIRALLCSGLWSQIEMPWVCLTPAWPMSLMVLLLSYKTKDHWKKHVFIWISNKRK